MSEDFKKKGLEPLSADFKPMSKPISEVYKQALVELAKPAPAVHLAHWPWFEHLAGGFRPNEYSIFCGATGIGKTTLLANWSQDLISQADPIRHFVMSIETGESDYIKRTMSVFAGRDLNTGEAVPVPHLKTFDEEHGAPFRGSAMWLGIYDRRVPIARLKQELTYHCLTLGCKIAFIDNLNYFLDTSHSGRDPIQEMDRVTCELIDLVKCLPMHIVMVMHPRKTENGRVESEFDIRGSATAVQEAHNIFLFNRPSAEDMKNDVANLNDRELRVSKLRRRGFNAGRRVILECTGSKYNEKKFYNQTGGRAYL